MNLALPSELSLPEIFQLAVPSVDGKLWPATVALTTAAMIDLALLGRIEATPSRRGFSWSAKLTVVDDTPLNNEPLDALLHALVASRRPRSITSCIPKIGVSAATSQSLADRGVVALHGTAGMRGSYLEPLDLDLRAECEARLRGAATSDNLRSVALLDITQWDENGWTLCPEGLHPPIHGVYPEKVALIAEGALHSLFIATGTSS